MDWGFVIVNAITLACIYGTLAIGLSITWSSVGLINMAYGFIFALAGYGAWVVAQYLPADFIIPVGLVLLVTAILVGALGGLLVCLLAFIPIHDKPNYVVRGMIATLAISLMGPQALMWWFGARNKALPPIFGNWKVDLFGSGVVMTSDKFGAVVASIGLLTAVLMWMRASRRGLEIRAMMMNPAAAAIVGIGVRKTGLSVMALTGGLAGLAAALLAQTYYISPFGGVTPMIKGLSVALCGGLGSVAGAVIAAIVLGINEAMTSRVLGGQYVLMTQFALIIIILLIRPRGIAGILDKAREA
jgi:branched-chain amino acid transport system permease protein